MAEKGPLTKEEIEQWLDLDARRKVAAREAEALDKQQKRLGEKLSAYLREKGGADRTTTHYGFVLAFKDRQTQVKWSEEFVRVAGLPEAERLRAEAPLAEFLVVSPTAA